MAQPADLPNLSPSLQTLLLAFDAALAAWQAQPDADQLAQLDQLQRQMQAQLPRQRIAPDRQSYLTEFHRQLRLLGTDLGFLKAARRTETKAQRLGQMGDRLQALQRYYEAMTGELA